MLWPLRDDGFISRPSLINPAYKYIFKNSVLSPPPSSCCRSNTFPALKPSLLGAGGTESRGPVAVPLPTPHPMLGVGVRMRPWCPLSRGRCLLLESHLLPSDGPRWCPPGMAAGLFPPVWQAVAAVLAAAPRPSPAPGQRSALWHLTFCCTGIWVMVQAPDSG